MLITSSVIINKKESFDESTHSQQSNFMVHETSNVINYAEWRMLDNNDNID